MSRRYGFTLVELLAVVVILAIILAVAIPGINKLLTSSKVSAYNSQMDLIKRAASLYITEHSEQTTVSLEQLITENLITDDIVNPVTKKPFDTGLTVNITKNGNTTSYEIYEGPTLLTGMIPVYYDDASGKWRKADKSNIDTNWYDYNNQKWANAVTVTTSSRETTYQDVAVGEAIEIADINAMFVWVPRYKYLIPAGTKGVAREISVVFETKYTPKSTGNAVSTYYTHPAFTFGTEELNGIWVGKFETTGDKTAPTILPDNPALLSQTVKDMYDSVKKYMQGSSTYGFSNDNDIHMMKNMEWGAVAYLSHSRYGKYGSTSYDSTHKELFLNNSSSCYTGRSSGAAGGSGILTPTYEYSADGYYTYDGKCASIYAGLAEPCDDGTAGEPLIDKNLAYGSSTTGTIYGIYDMSGGAYDYVMGIYKPSSLSDIRDCSGYSTSYAPPIVCPSTPPYDSRYESFNIRNEYYNQYVATTASTGYILGDATQEVTSWYGDYSHFVTSVDPWFVRGGYYYYNTNTGIFNFDSRTGAPRNYASFRVVINSKS